MSSVEGGNQTRTGLTIVVAATADAARLAAVSHAAKATYRAWARCGWQPPTMRIELERWLRRLRDHAGWTAFVLEGRRAIAAAHITGARKKRGQGDPIWGRAHLGGLFVIPDRWGEGAGSLLHDRAVTEMTDLGYGEAELWTAIGNGRSRTFYQGRGWQVSEKQEAHLHDGLWQLPYERRLRATP